MLCLLSHLLYRSLSQDDCTFACIEPSALIAYEPLGPWTVPALVSLPGMGSAFFDGDRPAVCRDTAFFCTPREMENY